MSPLVGVVCFPGTNCEHDVAQAVTSLGASARIIWHQERSLEGIDAVVIPGGFAHGDYLRPGAIARFSPVMGAIAEFAESGGPVIGICNGFQVLTEAGLLPGALVRNSGLRFLCRVVQCSVASTRSALTTSAQEGSVLSLPINHYEGRFVCDGETLAHLEASGRVVLRYLDNPNGSMNAIAGITNERGNVVGVMPHPERASDPLGVGRDGEVLLTSLLAAVSAEVVG
jgi:phosphoribosylformylglycinamidine synthase subunit PurQ / glutaminase